MHRRVLVADGVCVAMASYVGPKAIRSLWSVNCLSKSDNNRELFMTGSGRQKYWNAASSLV